MMPTRVLLVDDHPQIRRGLRLLLALHPDIAVVGEAAAGDEAVRLAQALRPDVVLMDLIMPGMDRVAATAVIRRTLPATHVLILSNLPRDREVAAALAAGAVGFVPKEAEVTNLLRAINAAVGEDKAGTADPR